MPLNGWRQKFYAQTQLLLPQSSYTTMFSFDLIGPITNMTNQGAHLINDAICYLSNHFILRHTSSIVYYPQGNG
jgi:hypothetical protein